VCFYSGDSSRPSVYSETTIKKSRKERKCSDCYAVIPVGSPYKKVFGVWDHEPETFSQCILCVSLRSGIESVEIDAGCSRDEANPMLGDLKEQLHEESGEYYKSLVRLGFQSEADHLCLVMGKDFKDEHDAQILAEEILCQA